MAQEKKTNNKTRVRLLPTDERARWWLLVGTSLLITVFLYPNLMVTKGSYNVGDVAEKNIKTPREFFVEDTEATEENRKAAVETVRTVYDFNEALAVRTTERVSRAFEALQGILREGQKSKSPLSQGSDSRAEESASKTVEGASGSAQASLHDAVWNHKKRFEGDLGIEVSKGAYLILEKEGFDPAIARLINELLLKIFQNGVVANKDMLLEEAGKGVVLRGIESESENVIHDLKRFYSLGQAEAMVRVLGDEPLRPFNHALRNLIVDFVQRLIKPNITLNISETENRKKAAAASIKPVLFRIKKGEMLLREGERITPLHVLKLRALQSHVKREHTVSKSAGIGLLIFLFLLSFYFLHFRDPQRSSQGQNKDLVFLCLTLVAVFVVAKVSATLSASLTSGGPYSPSSSSVFFGTPVAFGTMLVCLFLGFSIAVPFAAVTTLCVVVLLENPFEAWPYFLLSSAMGAFWIRDCRERKVFIRAGMKTGLLNMGLVTIMYLHRGLWGEGNYVWDVGLAFAGGMGAGVLTAGIAPLVEIAFDYTTDIKLLELANLDRPLLRRLMIEAPGTYHHSVIVGSMVEAAAAQINANPLLARVCAYYHDIGKVRKPLYFIENQMGGKNLHDKLAPSMSSLILIAHVREGVEMAKEHGLGRDIVETIRQHHGTSLISYFYEKARVLKGEDSVRMDDFRYPGPKPQTKEAGLVMLADVVEAASRSLDNPTPSKIQGLVQRLINKVFSEGQLDECELTLKDLHQIARSFNKILSGIHHHRIEYLERAARTEGKGKKSGAGIDRQPTKEPQGRPEEVQKNGTNGLRRLGMS